MELKLVNMMKYLVEQELERMLPHYPDLCRCDKCLLDIQAIALNSLPPHYVVSHMGELWARAENMSIQRQVDIQAALTKAIQIVHERPRHSWDVSQRS